MKFAEFEQLTIEERVSYLRHAVHQTRCFCKEYGFPWPDRQRIIDGRSIKHTPTICAPVQEFFPDP